jgi:hypothetical protein
MEENLLLLYEELGGDESFGSIESFSEAIKDPTNLQVVFEEAGGEEAFGSLEALSQAIGMSSTQETPQTTVPQGTPEVVRENPNKKSTDIRMDWDAWKNDHKEEGGFFSNMADWVTGTLSLGGSQGRMGNMVEADDLIGADLKDFSESVDYEQMANEFRTQREAQQKLGLDGELDTAGETFSVVASSVLSSLVGMVVEGTSDLDALIEVGGSTAAGAGIGAAGGALFGGAPAAPAALGGAKMGATRGLSLAAMHSSADVEIGNIFADRMREYAGENGLNVEDPEDLKKILQDEEFYKAAKSDALVGGGIVAAADLLTAGIAGKVGGKLASNATSTTVGSMLARRGVVSLVESTGAATGEFAKQTAIEDEYNLQDILLEFAGEGLVGQVQTAASFVQDNKIRKANITRDQLVDLATGSETETEAFAEAIAVATETGVVREQTAKDIVKSADEIKEMFNSLPDDIKGDRVRSREAVQTLLDSFGIQAEIDAITTKAEGSPVGVRKAYESKKQQLIKQKERLDSYLGKVADSSEDFKQTFADYSTKNTLIDAAARKLGKRPDRTSVNVRDGVMEVREDAPTAVKDAFKEVAADLGLDGEGVAPIIEGRQFESSVDQSVNRILGKAATTEQEMRYNSVIGEDLQLQKDRIDSELADVEDAGEVTEGYVPEDRDEQIATLRKNDRIISSPDLDPNTRARAAANSKAILDRMADYNERLNAAIDYKERFDETSGTEADLDAEADVVFEGDDVDLFDSEADAQFRELEKPKRPRKRDYTPEEYEFAMEQFQRDQKQYVEAKRAFDRNMRNKQRAQGRTEARQSDPRFNLKAGLSTFGLTDSDLRAVSNGTAQRVSPTVAPELTRQGVSPSQMMRNAPEAVKSLTRRVRRAINRFIEAGNGKPVGMKDAKRRGNVLRNALERYGYKVEVLTDAKYRARMEELGGNPVSSAATVHDPSIRTVFINGDKANAITFGHEGAHAAIRALQDEGTNIDISDLSEKLMARLQNGTAKERELHQKLTEFSSNYPEGAVPHEYVAELIGWMSANGRSIKESPSLMTTLRDFFQSIVDRLLGGEGNVDFVLSEATFIPFTNRLAEAFRDDGLDLIGLSDNNLYIEDSIEFFDENIAPDLRRMPKEVRENVLEGTLNEEDILGNPDLNASNVNDAFEGDSDKAKVNNRTLNQVRQLFGQSELQSDGTVSDEDVQKRAIAMGLISEDGLDVSGVDVPNALGWATAALSGEGLSLEQHEAMRVTIARLARAIEQEHARLNDMIASGVKNVDETLSLINQYENEFDILSKGYRAAGSTSARQLSMRSRAIPTMADADSMHRQFKATMSSKMDEKQTARLDELHEEVKKAYDATQEAQSEAEIAAKEAAAAEAKRAMRAMKQREGTKSLTQITDEYSDVYKRQNKDIQHQIGVNDNLDDLNARLAEYVNKLAASVINSGTATDLQSVVTQVQNHLATAPIPPGTTRITLSEEQIVRAIALTSDASKKRNKRKYNALISDLDNNSSKKPGTKQLFQELDKAIVDMRSWASGGLPSAGSPRVLAILDLVTTINERVLDRGLGLALGFDVDSEIYSVLNEISNELIHATYAGDASKLNELANRAEQLGVDMGIKTSPTAAVDTDAIKAKLEDKLASIDNDSVVDLSTPANYGLSSYVQNKADLLLDLHRKKYRMYQKELILRNELSNAVDPDRKKSIKKQLRGGSRFGKVWDFTRALKFSIDLSMILQQGGFSVLSGMMDIPEVAYSAVFGNGEAYADWKDTSKLYGQVMTSFLKDATRAQGSKGNDFTQDLIFDMMATDLGQQAIADGMSFSQVGDADLANREEIFRSDLAERIPGVKASGNVYTSFLNVARYHMYREFRRQYPGATAAQRQEYVTFIMDATGRNTSVKGLGEYWSAIFSAPRLYLAQMRMVLRNGPVAAAKLLGQSFKMAGDGILFEEINNMRQGRASQLDAASVAILKRYAKYAMGQLGVAMLLGVLGWEIEDDPKERNFGRYVMDDNVLDMSSGYQLYWRLPIFAFYRMGKGALGTAAVDEEVGEAKASQKGLSTRTISKDVLDAVRGKFNPSLSSIFAVFEGKNAIGQSYGSDWLQFAGNIMLDMYAPISLEDGMKALARSTRRSLGEDVRESDRLVSPPDYNPLTLLSTLGVNVIDYENSLRDIKVKDYLDSPDVDYAPSVTKKDAEKFIKGFTDANDDNLRLAIQQAFKADVEDMLGLWLKDKIDKQRRPSKEAIRAKKARLSRSIGRIYAKEYFPRRKR